MSELKQLFDLFVILANKLWFLTEQLIFLLWGIVQRLFLGIIHFLIDFIKLILSYF